MTGCTATIPAVVKKVKKMTFIIMEHRYTNKYGFGRLLRLTRLIFDIRLNLLD
jgi:hypothetical protein